MKVLSINTYGGSLLLGATALNADIIGSYEDSGFGLGIQQANFPHLNFIANQRDWPKQDLSETVVIAHPPCSAFSVQNSSKLSSVKGIDSNAFKCTREVLQYAMSNRALAISVESVMGALGGAWEVHQKFADENGYNIYRILQNGAMFGAQWRERFWAVFVRKGAAPDAMLWTLHPNYKTVGEVIAGHEGGPTTGNLDRLLEDLKHRLRHDSGLDDDDLAYLFEKHDTHFPTGGIQKVFRNKFFPQEDMWKVCMLHLGTFTSGLMCYVDPDGLCPTILGGSWFYINGRNMSETSYKALMGFPIDYKFPETSRKYRSQMRMYLSKGVIPQVASWVLENIFTHLGDKSFTPTVKATPNAFRLMVSPSQIADFRFKKKFWDDARDGSVIQLRNEED